MVIRDDKVILPVTWHSSAYTYIYYVIKIHTPSAILHTAINRLCDLSRGFSLIWRRPSGTQRRTCVSLFLRHQWCRDLVGACQSSGSLWTTNHPLWITLCLTGFGRRLLTSKYSSTYCALSPPSVLLSFTKQDQKSCSELLALSRPFLPKTKMFRKLFCR